MCECVWAPSLLLGFLSVSLWKSIRKVCVWVGSFPPPWILHCFLMKTIRSVCVCVGGSFPPWVLHYFLKETIRNVCVCVCLWAPSSSVDSSFFPMKTLRNVCVCVLLSSSLDSWRFHYENNKECVCVDSFPPTWTLHYFFMKTWRNACLRAPFLILGFFIISLWKQ